MANHEDYMAYCINLAKRAGKNTKTNPQVGSILVYKDQIIGEGFHEVYGQEHAERIAINDALKNYKDLISKSTLYVTLEPCFHQGKTPPCVNYVLELKIPTVVIGCADPFPLVASKSIQLLKENSVDVIENVLQKQCEYLLTKFRANLADRPHIILKWAQSEDGYMGKKDEQVWISNDYSKTLVHKWRSEVDGIMVGTQTVIQDNPALTTREWEGENPIRIVPDFNQRIPQDSALLVDGHDTIILTDQKLSDVEKVKFLQVKNKSIKEYWSSLFELGITSIIVEGGQKLLKEIIESGLWDEARIITSQKELNGGIKAPILIGELLHKIRLSDDLIVTILNDGS